MIEKSLTAPRKKKVKGQLHELAYITPKEAKLLQKSGGVKTKTSEGIFAYPPPGEKGGPGSGAEGRSPGGEGRGEYRSPSPPPAPPKPPAPKPKPKPKVEIKNPFEETGQTKKEQAKIASDVQELRDKVKTYAQEFTPDLYVDLDKYMEDKGLYSSIDKPTIDTGDAREKYISQQYIKPRNIYDGTDLEEQREIDRIRAQRQLQFSPNLSRDKRQNLEVGLGLRDPKQSSGIGSFLKNAAMAVVPGLLPAKLAQGYRLAKLGYDLKNRKGVYGTALRLGENLTGKNVGDFIRTGGSKFDRLNPNEMKNVRTVKPTRESGDGQRVKTVAEKVATGQGLESGAKLLGVQNTQKAELFKRRNMVENILRKGSYQGRDLTSGQKNNLRNYIEQINKFLVPVQQGI